MRRGPVLMACLACTGAAAQVVAPDSLKAVELAPFDLVHPAAHRGATATTVVDTALLLDFERSSLRSALQFVPGVQMDERGHGGSTRLSIRGSVLRSPFGSRNVKVYWGPVPLTLADGSTPLELLDPLLVEHVEVLRGVGHPRYGEAPAGVLLADPLSGRTEGSTVFAEAEGGSFGFLRVAARAGSFSGGNGVVAGALTQRNDGYRDQEWSARDQLFIASQWSTERIRWQVFLTAQDGRWALPGSLDQETANEEPRSARPYSEAIDARVEKQQFCGGVALEQQLGTVTVLRTSVGGNAIGKINPYGTTPAVSGSKDEEIGAINARLALASSLSLGGVTLAYEAGAEALWQRDLLEERAFVDAEPDSLRIHARTEVANTCLFASARAAFPKGWTLAAALGGDVTGYRYTDLLQDAAPLDRSIRGALPMVAVERRRARMRYHCRFARSISRPTIWELLGTRGTFNMELRPERWSEVELGVTRMGTTDAIGFNLYHRQVDDLITERQVDTGSTFVNSGKAWFTGAEADCRLEQRIAAQWSLRTIAAVGIQHAVREPDLATGIISVEGVEPFSFKLLVRAQHPRLPYLEAAVRIWSGISADSQRNESIPDGSVLSLRLGRVFQWRHTRLEAFVHCENMLDQRYNSWVQVNDPGGRYYNPAPARSYLLGAYYLLTDAPRP